MCLTVQDFMVLESWSLMWAETWSAKGSSIIADRESFAHKDPEGVRETEGGTELPFRYRPYISVPFWAVAPKRPPKVSSPSEQSLASSAAAQQIASLNRELRAERRRAGLAEAQVAALTPRQ